MDVQLTPQETPTTSIQKLNLIFPNFYVSQTPLFQPLSPSVISLDTEIQLPDGTLQKTVQ